MKHQINVTTTNQVGSVHKKQPIYQSNLISSVKTITKKIFQLHVLCDDISIFGGTIELTVFIYGKTENVLYKRT